MAKKHKPTIVFVIVKVIVKVKVMVKVIVVKKNSSFFTIHFSFFPTFALTNTNKH